MKKILVLTLGMAILTGCATTAVMQRPDFPLSEYEALNNRVGTGVVKGQAFLKTNGGDVKVAAGEEISLYPVTSYSNFWFTNAYLKGANLAPSDARYDKYIRKTIADAQGNFKFENIPEGEYFVVTSLTWQVPTGRHFTATTGGTIAKKIQVTNNKTIDVMLTH